MQETLRFIFCTAALSLITAHAEEEICPEGKQQYRTTIRHIESGGIGYKEGYTTFEGFFASDPSRWEVTPFLDVRAHLFNNGKWAANAGTGVRALRGNRVYGMSAYYDYRNTGRLNSNQIGAGFETLGERWDFRLNGYLPVGRTLSRPYDTAFKNFSGHHMILSQKYHSAMRGTDAELGFHFKKFRSWDFYAAAGPYYFIGKKTPSTWGGKARIGGTFKDLVTLEISDSYDGTFKNKFQGQLSLSFALGSPSKVKKQGRSCDVANTLNDRMLQPVNRQEIIVVDNTKKNAVAIDPATGLPYFFVFVDNTSSSDGTYESPYHNLAQAQDNSSSNNILYILPGDGTTKGMDSGILLKANQKLWGSGISHSLQTSQGTVSIPAQSSSWPTLTNTDVDTEGNIITLATNNSISGLILTSALNDTIYGTDAQNLEVSSCVIKNTSTFAIQASFSGDASVSITNNQFLDNVNGVFLTLHGTSTIICSDNTFTGQTSPSEVPLEIAASSNTFTAHIENNVFDNNGTGSIRFNLDNVVNTEIFVLNNIITNNGTGSQSSLGSSMVLLSTGTIDQGSINLKGNTFSGNASHALYLHTSGLFTNLEATVSENTISDNGGSGFVFATPVDHFTLTATDNTIERCLDNGIATIASGTTSTGNITISDNILTDIGNASNGIAINQNFSTLSLTISHNEIARCEGTGILSYAPTGIDSMILNISSNTIRHCDNMSSNAASGLDIEQYTNLTSSITNNTLSNNMGVNVTIGSTLTSPTTCLTLTGNSSADYSLTNPGDGVFNLSPCDADSVNTGTINATGTIDYVSSCSGPVPCSP